MRHPAIRLLLAPIAALSFAVNAAPDHYDAGALAAHVRELVDAGDFATARILLARAERISPEDARVVRARDALEARAAGRPAPPEPEARRAAAPPARTAIGIPPAPPAPWRLP